MLPHFQQHVKQLGHGEAVALRREQEVVSQEEERFAVSLTLRRFTRAVLLFLAAHRTFITFPDSSRLTHPHLLLPPCLYPHPHPAHPTSITLTYTEANKYKMVELLQIDQGYAKG